MKSLLDPPVESHERLHVTSGCRPEAKAQAASRSTQSPAEIHFARQDPFANNQAWLLTSNHTKLPKSSIQKLISQSKLLILPSSTLIPIQHHQVQKPTTPQRQHTPNRTTAIKKTLKLRSSKGRQGKRSTPCRKKRRYLQVPGTLLHGHRSVENKGVARKASYPPKFHNRNFKTKRDPSKRASKGT